MRIVFFIESLWTGGTQRRLLELLRYLKASTEIEIALVLTESEIHFKDVGELGLTIKVIERNVLKYDPRLFFKFRTFCQSFKPDIIHTWGIMTTFYAIPAKLSGKIPLITNMITDGKKTFKKYSLKNFFFNVGLYFSDVILANSNAGLKAYGINTAKAKVIYNGVSPERFQQNFDKNKIREEVGIKTTYVVIMVASFSKYKDYDLFVTIAKECQTLRDDVTFIAVGDGLTFKQIQARVKSEQVNNIILTGKQKEVERYIAAADIGLLCTYSEGISNSIIEYMSLRKPVISTDTEGGSSELIVEGQTGYCIERKPVKILTRINGLLNDKELCEVLGENGKKRIDSLFSIRRFGNEFEAVYDHLYKVRLPE